MPDSKYKALVATLKKNILDGKYGSGNPFPSVRALIRRHGLSNTTVLHAMDELVRQGLVSRKQGRGTFVTGVSSSRLIRLVIPGIAYSSEFFQPIIAELVRLARSRDYTIVMDGALLPAVFAAKPGADKDPVLVAAWGGREKGLRRAMPYLESGHPVLIADVTGVGEIGREMFVFYGAKERPDEGLGVMYYLMGEPLVGRRATDLLILAEVLSRRCGEGKPRLVADGPLVIPAAHAFAADPSAFAGVEIADAPKGWFDVLEEGARSDTFLYYADLVPGAALAYDWNELLNFGGTTPAKGP